MGKTRLALQAAEELVQAGSFKHGVFFCPLASVTCCQGVVSAVAEALSYQFRPETESRPQATPRLQLIEYLRRKQLLLVMDNYEHLLVDGASPEEAVSLIADLLAAAPGVKLLVTSRASLQVQGEHLYPVQGLQVPPGPLARLGSRPATQVGDPEQAVHVYSAVELFRQGVQQVRPGFELRAEDLAPVAQICRLVEGMPLGILLAAAWVEVLSPAEIAAEIERSLDFLETDRRDAPSRQRSIRAVFDYSWRLLDEREREVFQGLAIFCGGFSHQAALAVTGATPRDLLSLVNKSFVQPTGARRYDLHELLRQYAHGRLDDAPPERRAELHDRHCAYYSDALERWTADLKGSRQREAMDEIDLEIENARAAWLWAVAHGQVDRLAQGIGALVLYYTWRVRFEEGETALRAAVQDLKAIADSDPGARLLLPKALALWGDLLIEHGRQEPGIEAIRQAMVLLDDLEAAGHDVRAERALALYSLARVKRYFYPDPRDAEALYRQGVALFEEVGDRWGMARGLDNLSLVVEDMGRFREAQALCEQSLAISQALGDRRGMAGAMLDLGIIAWVQGHLDDALPLLEQSAGIFRSLDDWNGLAWTVKSLGEVLVRRGLFDDGLVVLESSSQISDELGDNFGVHGLLPFLAEARLHLGQYAEALADARQTAAFAAQVGHRWTRAFAQFIHGMAALALPPANRDGAATGEALALLQESAAGFEEIRHRENWGWVAGPLGLAAHLAGDEDLARQMVREALHTGVGMGVFMPLMYGLPVAARLLADRGDIERAAEVYACAARSGFVANSRWFQDLVGAHIEAAAVRLPEEALATARERGQAQTWEEMARQVVGEL